jgi:Fe-S oxidoreductase
VKVDERILAFERTLMLGSFLKTNASNWQPPRLDGYTLLVHGHCHQKSLLSMSNEVSLLRATGAQVGEFDAGCCGMAGPFGFEKDKYEISRNLAERVLLPAARQSNCGHDLGDEWIQLP